MNANKQISLEQLFRLYPQLRQTSQQNGAHTEDGQGTPSDAAANMSAGRADELAEA